MRNLFYALNPTLILAVLIASAPWLVRARVPEAWPYSHTSEAPHLIRVLEDGVQALDVRLNTVEHATKSIDLMVYSFELDDSSFLLLHRLVDRAAAGVRVRILLDWYNEKGSPDLDEQMVSAIRSSLQRQGVSPSLFEVRYYNRGKFLGDFERVNHRNHSKMLIIDGNEAIIGGRNVGDGYFSVNEGGFEYVDRELWITGESLDPAHNAVIQASAAFNAYWTNEDWVNLAREREPDFARTPVLRAITPTDTREALFRADVARIAAAHPLFSHQVNRVSFVIDRPGSSKSDRVVTPVVNSILEETDQYMAIENYSLPVSDKRFEILKDVAARDVPLLILTNSFDSFDSATISAFAQKVEARLLRRPFVWIFEMTGLSLPGLVRMEGRQPPTKTATHTKTIVSLAKSRWLTAVGSYNFDVRSEKTNNECMLIVDDTAVATEALGNIAKRMQFSHPISVGADGRLYYADLGQPEKRDWSLAQRILNTLGLGKLLRSMY